MIQAMNSPPCTAKAAEIMSRYRPIAPRPEPPTPSSTIIPPSSSSSSSPEREINSSTHIISSLPQNIRQSPYLMNVWPHLQARPTRTRKRGRTALAPCLTKRPRGHLVPLAPAALFPLQAHGFPRTLHQFQLAAQLPGLVAIHNHNHNHNNHESSSTNLVTLPLLPPSIPILASRKSGQGIDLNREAEIPEEKDFLQQLQGSSVKLNRRRSAVFTPQAVRPVCSSICVGPMMDQLDLSLSSNGGDEIPKRKKKKKKEEVEEEMESEGVPAVVSDSNNKVRLANSAYMEMVGQPECSWLESCACKRICGEVMLHFCESSCVVPLSSNGFSCWVTIEWGSGRDGKGCSVNAFCDVVKLCCETKEYLYAWRFHTASSSSSSHASASSASASTSRV